ncbi:MAG: NADP-dependent oxidoreductase [Steroidobacteraceae bacterium]
MKAARIHSYGQEPLIEEAAVPDVGPAEVLVRVGAASLNPLDVKLQQGVMSAFFLLRFPYTLGTDLAGTIEQLGAEVSGWCVGDRVVARTDPTSGGALAELAAVPASYLVRIPDTLTLEQAAGIPTAGGTAWQALLEVADLKPRQTILVQAGAGGVGSFAIQLARSIGARVIATASGSGIEIARRLGADQVIDYREQNFAEELADLDVVLDTIGGETQRRSLEVLRAGGALVATVSAPDEPLAKAHKVRASFVFHTSDASRLAKVVESVRGGTKVLIDRVVKLTSVLDAFTYQGLGRARGKIILIP